MLQEGTGICPIHPCQNLDLLRPSYNNQGLWGKVEFWDSASGQTSEDTTGRITILKGVG